MADIDSRVESLRAALQPIVRTWLHVLTDDLRLRVSITETLRSQERQAELLSCGMSQVKQGWHQVGLAWDFACFDDKGVYITDGTQSEYKRAGQIAEALGAVWGGRWLNHPDYDHCEWHPGFTLQQLLDGKKDGVVT